MSGRWTARASLVAGFAGWMILAATLVGLVAPAGAAANVASPSIRVVINGGDFYFSVPDRVEAGLVSLTLVNVGGEPHQANLARIRDGFSYAQVLEAAHKGEAAMMPMLEWVGGPNTVKPGGRQEVIVSLQPGEYVVICMIPSHDGVPHFAKGMIDHFTVVPAAGASMTPREPKADLEVEMLDFSFRLPATLPAGEQVWRVVNRGAQPHEVSLVKLAPGKSFDDLKAFFQHHPPAGPPPFEDAGGIGAIAPGGSGWVKLNLQPGNYVALCFVPDPRQGVPHLAMGMMAPFTVRR